MRARKVGRQSQWDGSTALAETENLSEPRPTCVHRITEPRERNVSRPGAHGLRRALPFAIVLDIAIVGIVVGMCYLVSFLMHNPAWFVAFVCGCVLAILVGFRAEGKS
jgi:hypothetical protein